MQKNMCTQVYRGNSIIPFGHNNGTFAKVEGDLLLTVKVHYCTNMILISQYKVTALEEDYIVQKEQKK